MWSSSHKIRFFFSYGNEPPVSFIAASALQWFSQAIKLVNLLNNPLIYILINNFSLSGPDSMPYMVDQ